MSAATSGIVWGPAGAIGRVAALRVLAATFFAIGCQGQLTDPVASRIEIVSGNAQMVAEGAWLSQPLTVRVTDGAGRPLAGVEIAWSVDAPVAEARAFPSPVPLAGTTRTDPLGLARIVVRYALAGTHTVSASIDGVPGALVRFTALVIAPTSTPVPSGGAPVVIRFAPDLECRETGAPVTFHGDGGTNRITVSVGTVVEWVFDWPEPCRARLVSTGMPSEAHGFDSGSMRPGDRFRFVPTVPGTWSYRDAVSGGEGTLTVRRP